MRKTNKYIHGEGLFASTLSWQQQQHHHHTHAAVAEQEGAPICSEAILLILE